MNLHAGAHVAVVDGERFILFRNIGDAVHPQLGEAQQPDTEATNKSQGKLRPSITTNQHKGNDLDEAAHSASVAAWLNHAVLTHAIDKLVIIADTRTLGEMRRHYHKELEDALIGEIAKSLTHRPVPEIEKAIAAV